MLYTKNGSIPKPETDGTEGWIEVEMPPEAPEGKEVVWWYPPGWVIRDLKPAAEEGFVWKWAQSQESWVKYELPKPVIEVVEEAAEEVTEQTPALTSDAIPALTSSDIPAIEGDTP